MMQANKSLIIITLTIFLATAANAWYDYDYNTSFTFNLTENNGTARQNMPYTYNFSYGLGLVDNCSNIMLTKEYSNGTVEEIMNEIPYTESTGGWCYIRFLVNTPASTSQKYVIFTNTTKPHDNWNAQIYDKPYGKGYMQVWEDKTAGSNGTLATTNLNLTASGWLQTQGVQQYSSSGISTWGGSNYQMQTTGMSSNYPQLTVALYMKLNSTINGTNAQIVQLKRDATHIYYIGYNSSVNNTHAIYINPLNAGPPETYRNCVLNQTYLAFVMNLTRTPNLLKTQINCFTTQQTLTNTYTRTDYAATITDLYLTAIGSGSQINKIYASLNPYNIYPQEYNLQETTLTEIPQPTVNITINQNISALVIYSDGRTLYYQNTTSIVIPQTSIPDGTLKVKYNPQGVNYLQTYTTTMPTTDTPITLYVENPSIEQGFKTTSTTGTVLPNARIAAYINNNTWTEVYSTYTDTQGTATLNLQPYTTYLIRTTLTGYNTDERTIDTLSAATATVQIKLSETANYTPTFYNAQTCMQLALNQTETANCTWTTTSTVEYPQIQWTYTVNGTTYAGTQYNTKTSKLVWYPTIYTSLPITVRVYYPANGNYPAYNYTFNPVNNTVNVTKRIDVNLPSYPTGTYYYWLLFILLLITGVIFSIWTENRFGNGAGIWAMFIYSILIAATQFAIFWLITIILGIYMWVRTFKHVLPS